MLLLVPVPPSNMDKQKIILSALLFTAVQICIVLFLYIIVNGKISALQQFDMKVVEAINAISSQLPNGSQ